MLTKHPITVHYGWLRKALVLPAGTRLDRATNIPEPGCYWVRSIPRSVQMDKGHRAEAVGWMMVYGFLIRPDQLAS
jgi:hypothetical protein